MRFIREMIARKAAGDDQKQDDMTLAAVQNAAPVPEPTITTDESTVAGFEDEIESQEMAPEPIATAAVEPQAEAETPAPVEATVAEQIPTAETAVVPEDEYDEDAELEALDAAFPDLEDEASADDKIDRLFPQEEVAAPSDEVFADIPEPKNQEPMPQLTAEDIKRAMKNRKKIWHNLPEEGDDPFAFVPDETNDAVTRPIRRPSAFQESRPVSVPLELMNPTLAEEEQEPAMEAPAPQAESPEEPAEMASMIVQDEVPELASLFTDDAPEETAPVAEVPEPAETLSVVADEGPMEIVVDDDEDEREVLWPRATVQDEAPEMEASEAVPIPEPSEPAADSPNIQAMMARAALEAAGNTAAIDAAASEEGEAKPARRAGRVKTRLLGFQPDEAEANIFETSAAAKSSEPDMFPVGWLVVVEGPGRGASFCLHNGVSLIGRGDDQAVRLDFGDTSISRDNHASIAFDDEAGQFFLGHGGKSNIVRLNSKPVLSTEDLAHGDQIRIGETKLRFQAFCSADFSWTENTEDGTGNAAVG